MSKNLIVVDDEYYFIDDETGEIKEVIIKDNADLSPEKMKKILKFLATHFQKD